MTQHSQLIALFRSNGNRLTLSQLMQPPLGREHSARMAELRKQGYRFICHFANKQNGAGQNIYEMIEPYPVEENGQLRMVA
jgi:hypothetical protein